VWVSILLRFGLPQFYLIRGPANSYVSLLVSALLLLLAVFSIYIGRKTNPPPIKNPTFFRWILFFTVLLILFIGFVIFNVSIFSPYLFGAEQPVPKIGIISWLITSFIVSPILYASSRMNSTHRPNLMRYVALSMIVIAALLTTVKALIFIFAMPFDPPATFPFYAGLMTLAFLPFSLVVLGLSKDYVLIQKQAKPLQR
jgi:hypothetical protein